MIKHIVFWKLKDHAEGADRAANAVKMKALLDSCAHLAPGTLKFEAVLAQPGFDTSHDVVLYSEFADLAAFQAYQEHPGHIATKPFIAAVRESRHCMDFEI
ncbi:MAG TPA: Dabb family protein [Janthinobacterium sp.]|nr:Dabb family protein [Janthinobacterium sp.]